MSGQIEDEKKQLFRIQISRGHHWLNNGKDFQEITQFIQFVCMDTTYFGLFHK